MLGHVFYTATHFGLYNNMLLYGEKKQVPFHVSIELMIGLGTASLGWTVELRRQRMAP